jgi:hypothetical protein
MRILLFLVKNCAYRSLYRRWLSLSRVQTPSTRPTFESVPKQTDTIWKLLLRFHICCFMLLSSSLLLGSREAVLASWTKRHRTQAFFHVRNLWNLLSFQNPNSWLDTQSSSKIHARHRPFFPWNPNPNVTERRRRRRVLCIFPLACGERRGSVCRYVRKAWHLECWFVEATTTQPWTRFFSEG